jgi:hypothetical protein
MLKELVHCRCKSYLPDQPKGSLNFVLIGLCAILEVYIAQRYRGVAELVDAR